MTAEQLTKMGASDSHAHRYISHLNRTVAKYGITAPLRLAHFFAQLFHESGSLRYSEELASGDAYEGREDLGNTVPGDGRKFKGRGLIQVTGRLTYGAYGNYVGVDVVGTPELLAAPEHAADSAGWFWSVFKKDRAGLTLNDFADADQLLRITYFVNGGFNGLADRLAKLRKAYETFGVPDAPQRLRAIVAAVEANLAVNPRVKGMDKALFREIPDQTALSKLRKVLE